jgi:hypothetical protein
MLEYFLSHFGLFLKGVEGSRYLVGPALFFVLIRDILVVTLLQVPLLHSQIFLCFFGQFKQLLLFATTL